MSGTLKTCIAILTSLAIFVVIFLVSLFVYGGDESRVIGAHVGSFQELEQRFAALADEKGALYAYDILRKAPLPEGTDLHLLGHAVGDKLYAQKGTEGIALCTEEFRNACSHSIVIGTLNELGPSQEALALIDASCRKAPGGLGAYTMCYHGLGHGVLAYFGYDLKETSAFCGRMSTQEYQNEQGAQCIGGAIMELVGGGGHDRDKWLTAQTKYFNDRRPLSPCDTSLVPQNAKVFCYSYLTPRFLLLAGAELAAPDPSTFEKAMSYCGAVPAGDTASRRACFGGFGKEFVPMAAGRDIRTVGNYSDEVYTRAIQWCALGRSLEARTYCIAEALESVFWGGENNPDASFRFCSLVQDPDESTACYEALARGIARYLPQDAMSLCQRIPPAQRALCSGSQEV